MQHIFATVSSTKQYVILNMYLAGGLPMPTPIYSKRQSRKHDPEHFKGRSLLVELISTQRRNENPTQTASYPAQITHYMPCQTLTPKQTFEMRQYSSRSLGLLLGSTNMCVVHLCCKLETGNSLLQMGLQWADHDKHECLRVSAQRVLEQIGKLQHVSKPL